MQNWSSNIEYYELSHKYSIVKANPEEFAIYESVYGDKIYNRFAVKHWDLRLAISLDNPFAKDESFYWIKAGELRIGGVLIEPNVLSRLFIIPPFTNTFEIVKLLKKLLVKWSSSSKNIYAYQIPPEQSHYFEMLGFWPDKNRRWMMRPTEAFDFVWDNTIIVKTPQQNNNVEIAKLFYESFNGDIDCQYAAKQNGQECTYEEYLDEINDYFNNCTEDILLEASTLIYDKEEKKLIGACLVSHFEEWPLIHTIGVDPSYRGKHLATTMLKKALTVLKKEYPILRLFVTIGNVAESVYYELGFIPGTEFKRFIIKENTSC
ncbi:GNAT family N-acetyltransferase [Clostridium ganghwense]|uniref:GNAT family N-acetyltransferase n=1 Tax=Clostridium ganghwense TaxID=312089 RepID=A0ABT4CNG5_9CLOT|nr:GNAT family N-acetyltransferase [Clostridium ganghwense]MCY6370599.1 GNAT family N-acetyltransferase [Clostridium ganghwense]